MGYREDILATSGLVGYWRFNEANDTAGVIAQTGPSGIFPATRPNLNQAGALVGDTDTCYRFAASNSDYIYWSGSNFTFANRAAFSVEIWVNPTAIPTTSGYMSIVSKDRYDANASGYGVYISNVSRRVFFTRISYYDGVTNTQGPIVNVGSWYHIVCTYDGTTQRVYSNKTLVASTTSTYNMSANTSTPLTLGKSCESNTQYLSAYLDEFALYNRALTQTEINDHYDSAMNPIIPEEGSANLSSKFSIVVNPSRNRTSGSLSRMTSSMNASPTTSVLGSHAFTIRSQVAVDASASSYPTHSVPTNFELTVDNVRHRRGQASLPTRMPVTVRMPMIFQENHTLAMRNTLQVAPKANFKMKSTSLPVRFPVSFSGMTRMEVDQLFRTSAQRRSGAIHFAVSRLTRESLSIQHYHSNTLEAATETPFVATTADGTPRVVGTATVEWYISRVTVDATDRVHTRPDVLEHFGIEYEVTG